MDEDDLYGRANREAVAILYAHGVSRSVPFTDAVSLLAVAWIQGLNLQTHETLNGAERALERLREDLTA